MMAEWQVIDLEKCDGCGLCVEVCLRQRLVLLNDKVAVLESVQVEECCYCAQCEAICPTGAICCIYEVVLEEDIPYRPRTQPAPVRYPLVDTTNLNVLGTKGDCGV